MKSINHNQQPTLKTLRESVGLTQKELSHRLGLAESTIGFWEQGRKLPRVDKFLALARELGVSPLALARAMKIDTSGIPSDEKNL